jgi:hypothetical protein
MPKYIVGLLCKMRRVGSAIFKAIPLISGFFKAFDENLSFFLIAESTKKNWTFSAGRGMV